MVSGLGFVASSLFAFLGGGPPVLLHTRFVLTVWGNTVTSSEESLVVFVFIFSAGGSSDSHVGLWQQLAKCEFGPLSISVLA